MKLLLDTQAFIMLVERRGLPQPAQAKVDDPQNTLFLSLVSPWEIQIKLNTGKLKVGKSVRETVIAELAARTLQLLPITFDHIDALSALPDHHRDPFDRLLIAQAIVENLTIVTGDDKITRYSVPTIWR